ncbi:non-hydrolyzing UDP-N-acetylglucosamine 2-epimerase [Lentzea flava]|uniref:UDP-N-acetylglucosamine 2-epimerase (non-hydrolyzing) n=1 Tax=Lentzea flava TaxID=103732 RepID=A0ABQ2UTH9_9PSEU|nr:UDP-N-acetylglucosamine 2-epimerase (non-hydrolyzing) [Lentzea flava]GGU53002.1 UDP-N-acetyl glucosamine 2-epimerase [Lentzea flava]
MGLSALVPGPRQLYPGEVPEVFLVAGTRPEAVKMAPVAAAMFSGGRIRPVLVNSGQHPEMVDQALESFGFVADVALKLNRVTGGQAELTSQLIEELDRLFTERTPAAVLVQGDTTTTLAGALAAFWHQIPVVHLEAGLRSHDLTSPFPEEGNRKMVGQLASLHLAPTADAAAHLAAESLQGNNVLTIGNTVVDAVLDVAARRAPYGDARLQEIENRVHAGQSRLVLVTTHRRESWGEPLDRVLHAVADIVEARPDVEVVLPAHPNPAVRRQVLDVLGGISHVTITDPLPYAQMARLLAQCTLALSDSGGIQEEAPSFGVPALVLRDVTERMEAVNAGCAVLVGTDRERITSLTIRLLDNPSAREAMTADGNPFGDGLASVRTEQALAWLLGLQQQRPVEFAPYAGSATVRMPGEVDVA